MDDRNRKPRARMIDGRWVVMQATTFMAEDDWQAAAKEFRDRMRRVCKEKAEKN